MDDEEAQVCVDPSLVYGPPAPEETYVDPQPTCEDSTSYYEGAGGGGETAAEPFQGMYDGSGSGSGVEFCERPADIPGMKQLGIAHWWLRTPNAEAGMGPYHGG